MQASLILKLLVLNWTNGWKWIIYQVLDLEEISPFFFLFTFFSASFFYLTNVATITLTNIFITNKVDYARQRRQCTNKRECESIRTWLTRATEEESCMKMALKLEDDEKWKITSIETKPSDFNSHTNWCNIADIILTLIQYMRF